MQHTEGEAALFASRREIVGPLLGVGIDLVQMFPEIFVGIVQDVAVEFLCASVGVDVLVRAALGEVDTAAAENAQEAIGIPAAVLEEAVVIPRAPRRSEAAEIGGRVGQGGEDGVTERFRTDFVLIKGNHPIGFDEAEGVFKLGEGAAPGMLHERRAVLPGDGLRGVGTERIHDDDGVTERERLKAFPEQAFAVVGEDQTRNGGFSGRIGTHARSLVREETTSRTAPATAAASASESSGYMGRLRMRGMTASVTGRPSGASATLPR